MLAQLSGGVLGALLCKGLLEDEGRAANYGAANVSGLLARQLPGSDRRGDRHLLPGARDPRGCFLEKELQGVGAACDRHHPGLPGHGRRTAHRRLLQPGPLVRSGAGRQRLGRVSGLTWSARSSARCSRPPSSGSCSRPEARPRPSRRSRSKTRRRSPRRRSPTRRSPKPSRLPDLSRLLTRPGPARPGGLRPCSFRGVRRVTFSRNYTLSLSRTCQCYCKYCAFATHRAHIHAPEEVERRLDEAGAPQRQGAARPHRRAARGQPRGRRAARRVGPRGLHLLRRLGLRARPGARHPAPHQPRRPRP